MFKNLYFTTLNERFLLYLTSSVYVLLLGVPPAPQLLGPVLQIQE